MDINITHKMIKDMCGAVSFKKGQSFYQGGKVILENDSTDSCFATVKSTEHFQVSIEKDTDGSFHASCSCPKLAGFSKSCQHIAAVLIAIYEQKKPKIILSHSQMEQTPSRQLSDDFFALFDDKMRRTSGHQRHFEKRQVLDVHFTLMPIQLENNEYLFGIALHIEQMPVRSIRDFLASIRLGNGYSLSPTFHYHSQEHCFVTACDAVLQQLVLVVRDEAFSSVSVSETNGFRLPSEILFIPPSAWAKLVSLLQNVSSMTLQQDGQDYDGLQIMDEPPPIHFMVEERNEDYQLTVHGFERGIILNGYHAVLIGGKVFQLQKQSSERLIELKQMLESPNADFVIIPREQVEFFLTTVVPKLKKIGHVEVSRRLMQNRMKTPLVAKLYLDRLKNRLLAGLEFQYGQFVIQPLEEQDISHETLVMRDVEKEAMILTMMEGYGFTKTDGGYYMQNEELEYHFLYHALPKLKNIVQIYATSAVRLRIVKENIFPKIRVKVQKERTNWLEFKFEMDGVTDKQIKEILVALEVKQKYYRLPDGGLLSLETREMEEIQRFLQANPIQDDHFELTFNQPIVESLKFLDLMEESEVFAPEESFRQFSQQLRKPEMLSFEVPESLRHILRAYQQHGYYWLKHLASYGFGGILADDMGLGKTLQSIAFIVSELPTIRQQKQPVLIVCPSSLAYNWLHEMRQFAPELQAVVIDGNATERKALLQSPEEIDVVITTYPTLRRDVAYYEKLFFHTVFFDEAQAFKNPITQTARAVKKIQAGNRFGLTGTPIENSLTELWSIYRVVFPQLFQGLEEYSHLHRKDIARRVRPFLLRRMKEDVLMELPGKEETLEYSELLVEQKTLYAAYLAKLRYDTLKHLDKETFKKNQVRILAGITRLRQICCHPALFVEGYKGSSAKFEQLLHILEESRASGRRVLIFSQFTQMLKLIATELSVRGQTYFYLDGQTPPEERVSLCQRFNTGEQDVFLISLKAGGTGLNLTGADTVILYDLWWNPAVEQQAADRAYRMGQKKMVQVIKLIARGTIEEKMNVLQEKKRVLIADILQSDDKVAMTLTAEDIREILML